MAKVFNWEVDDYNNWKDALKHWVGPRLYGKTAYRPASSNYSNYPFTLQNAAGGVLTSGTVFVTMIELPPGLTVTNLYWFSGSTALVAGTGQTYWTALFDKSGVLLGQSTSSAAKAVAASSVISDALATPYVTTYGGAHYIGVMNAQTGGTMPTIGGFTGLTTTGGTAANSGVKFNGTADASLTTTAPTTLGTITGVAVVPWVGTS